VALILDTGPLYASLDRSDDDHERCRSLIESADEPLLIPAPVLVEVDADPPEPAARRPRRAARRHR